jgi:adenylate cyclase
MKLSLRRLFSVNPVSLTLGSVLLVTALFATGVPILNLTELRTYDLRFLSRGPLTPSLAVAIAAIDEKSLDVEGRWPWPRSTIARLVDALSEAGAKVIAFDVGFLEPDENSRLVLIDELGRAVDELGIDAPELNELIESRRQEADNDRLLAEAIQRSPASVVLGYFFHENPEDLDYEIEASEIDRRLQLIDSSKYALVSYRNPDIEVVVDRAYAPEVNLERLTAVAESSGYFTLRQDRDGIVRWLPLMIQSGAELFPPLAIQAVWHFLDEPQMMVHVDRYGGVDGVQLGDRFVPTNERGRLLINFLGPPKTIPHHSISDILAGDVPADAFRGRIVLVAATATGIYDMRSTPFKTVFPGAEIHASVIDNILTGDFITKPDWSRTFDLAAIVLLGSLVGIGLSRMGALPGLLFAVALAALHVVVARQLFVAVSVWLNIVYPLLSLGTTYTAITVYRYLTEERERKKVRSAFGRYVSPVVIEQMLGDPSKLELGGEEKVLTVLFSDLQGFTSHSERSTPQQMIELLSDYYARMTEHIFERDGMLKEYVGDELMAIFGAPIDQPDHAERACAAALEMLAHRRRMSEEWVAMGRPPLIARTGVNSGKMLVGNIGSEYRLAYGALGDEVNLGSRLEGMNKAYATQILIGENTAELVGSAFQLREVDMVRVVGKQRPMPDKQEAVHAAYAAGLAASREHRWERAMSCFEQALALNSEDGPSRTMLERCRVYRESPPPADWDGVYEATKK